MEWDDIKDKASNKQALGNSLDEQQLGSGEFLKNASSITASQTLGSIILSEGVPAGGENVIEMSMQKSADVLNRNLEKISKMDIDEDLEDDAAVHMRATEYERFASVQDIPRSKAYRGEELIKQRQRGSVLVSRRMSLYPRAIRRHEDSQETTIFPVMAASRTRETVDDSENLGVHSMLFEMPPVAPLSALEAAVIVSILRETLLQLTIIRHAIPAGVDDRWSNDGARSVDEKYGIPDEPNFMFREEMGLLPLIPTSAEKIQRERTYVHKIIERTAREIENCGRLNILEFEVGGIAKLQEAERNLEASCQIWMNQVKQLRDLIEAEKESNKRHVKKILKLERQTVTHVDDVIFFNGSKLGFNERWEDARLEQQNFQLAIKEEGLQSEIKECLNALNTDGIVWGDVRAYLDGNIDDLQQEITAWSRRYNDELELRQSEIDELKELVELQKVELQEMYNLRDQRQPFVDKYVSDEEEIARKAEYWNSVHNAATKIQSQWRGYMVRRQLGPFKNLWTKLKTRKKSSKKTRKKRKIPSGKKIKVQLNKK